MHDDLQDQRRRRRPEFVQTVSVKVNDVTPPTVSCGPGVNPDGHTPGGGRNAGFLRMVAVDKR